MNFINYLTTLSLLASAFGGCSSKESSVDSEVNIVGGRAVSATDDPFKHVIKLVVHSGDVAENIPLQVCSGVIVNDRTVLAASHCIRRLKQLGSGYSDFTAVIESEGNKTAKSYKAVTYAEPIAQDQIKEHHVGLDLAAIEFAAGTFGHVKFATLSPSTDLKEGQDVTLVGFGATNGDMVSGAGAKNWGQNKLKAIESSRGYLTITASKSGTQGANAYAARGDSGGPLFDDQGRLIGIGSAYFEEGDTVTNYYVDLRSEASQTLLGYFKASIDPFGQSKLLNEYDTVTQEKFDNATKFAVTSNADFNAMCHNTNSGGLNDPKGLNGKSGGLASLFSGFLGNLSSTGTSTGSSGQSGLSSGLLSSLAKIITPAH